MMAMAITLLPPSCFRLLVFPFAAAPILQMIT
jgi:hypothetical protein